MSSTVKIKRPDMPVPAQASVTTDSVGRYYNIKSYTLAQIVERDAQWQEMVGPVVEALKKVLSYTENWPASFTVHDCWKKDAAAARAALSAITEE